MVVGSFAVGMTIRAPKLPIFGETMLGTDFDMGPGGKGSNQAVATARLGARSSLLAMVGDDKLASIATDLYSAEGVDASLVTTRAERATGVGFIILNAKGENFIILDMGANELLDAEAVDAGEAQIAASDVVMTVLEVPTSAAARAMELGCKHGATTILNPAPARALPRRDIRVRRLSDAERKRAAHPSGSARRRSAIVARARAGASPTRRSQRRHHARARRRDDPDRRRSTYIVPAIEVEVTDTTGAGDAFNSGFAVALAEGRDLVEAVRFGVACGGIACTRLGVIPSLPGRARADAAL